MSTFIIWIKGLLSAVVGGVATTLTALIGGQIIGEQISWKTITAVALSAAVTTALGYLAKSPLPEEKPEVERGNS